jgi:PEP-CTERM motif
MTVTSRFSLKVRKPSLRSESCLWALSGMIAICLASPSSADVITGWDFSPLTGGAGNWGASPLTPTQTLAGVTSGGLVRGSGILTPAGSSAAARAWGGTDFLSTSLATAVTNNDFITFTVAPTTGNTLSLSDIGAYNIRRSATGSSTGQWQYAVGGGTFSNLGTPITWGATTSAAGNAQSAIVLSGIPELQSIVAGTDVTFRLAFWGGTSTGGTSYLNDPLNSPVLDFLLNGTLQAGAVIPEPGTLALIALGVAALVACRRK